MVGEQSSLRYPQRSDGHTEEDHFAQHCLTIGYNGRFTCRYPIFNTFIRGESRELCAEVYTIPHTLRTWEGSMRLRTLTISGLEPRASLSGNGNTGTAMTGSRLVRYRMVVYPGCVGGAYSPGCTLPTMVGSIYPGIPHPEVYPHPEVAHPEVCHPIYTLGTTLGIPPWVHLPRYHPGYTSLCTHLDIPPWVHPMCTPRVYHLRRR